MLSVHTNLGTDAALLYYLGEGVTSEACFLLAVSLLNHLTAPCGHGPEEQGFVHTLWLRGSELSDVTHPVCCRHLYRLPIILKLQVSLS